MKRFGLIGKTLSHSFSPTYFQKKFESLGLTNHSYELFELAEISEVQALLAQEAIHGLNVTIPYKQSVIPFLDIIEPNAQEIGAVNCIVFKEGKTIGCNTDVIGFGATLYKLIDEQKPKALIFGTGGSAQMVAYMLRQLQIEYEFVGRTSALNYDTLSTEKIKTTPLLINTTPVGMYPDTDALLPIPYTGISDKHFAYDLVYNPNPSSFLKRCSASGAQTMSGLKMLEIQADVAWKLWQ